MHNGVDIRYFSDLPDRQSTRESLGLAKDDLMVLYAGRLSPEKGCLLLPTILQSLVERVPSVRLTILGEGMLQSSLAAEFAERGLSDRVSMAGYCSDTRPYLTAADLQILPSYKEGLPNVLLESMAAGLPAVATRAGGIPEAVEPGVTGELVSVADVGEMVDACSRILSDPDLRRAMGQASADRAQKSFSIHKHIRDLEGVFEEALSLAA